MQLRQPRIQVNKQKMNKTPVQLHADLMADTVAYPVLSATELEKCAEFGTRCSFAPGEDHFRAGAQPFDCYVILSGEACIIDVTTDEPTYQIRHRGGQFTGDIDLFTGRRAAVSCQAIAQVEAIRIRPDKVREMFVRQPSLGARIWLAFQRRRDLLMTTNLRSVSPTRMDLYGDVPLHDYAIKGIITYKVADEPFAKSRI